MTLYFTAEEVMYRRRQEVGYDIDIDTHYNAWLRLQDTFTFQKQLDTNIAIIHQPVNLLKPTGILAKVLNKQASRIKLPVISYPSFFAKVITSEEN